MARKLDPNWEARQSARFRMLAAARLYAFVLRMDGIRRALSDGAYQKQPNLEDDALPEAGVSLFDDPLDIALEEEPLGMALNDAQAFVMGAAEEWARLKEDTEQ